MSHHFIMPTNENGMILDSAAQTNVDAAMGTPFGFRDVFLYSHGWWTDAIRAVSGYNRFTIEYSKFFRSQAPLAGLQTLNIGIHWPSTLTEDQFSLRNYFEALSFYTMEKRGDTVGENAVYTLLRLILAARPPAPTRLRIHLLGHSFGCKVVCRGLDRVVEEDGAGQMPAEVSFDLALLQGAFNNDEMDAQQTYGSLPGIAGLRVLITRSDEDRALQVLYPTAHRLARLIGEIKPALGAAGPSPALVAQFGGATQVDVGPDFDAGATIPPTARLVVADLTRLHQAHPDLADEHSGHHSDIFHTELYSLLTGFYFSG
jgi:hypothetical protein